MRKLLAITRLTLWQAQRNKVFIFMAFLMFAFLVFLPFMITSDGTLKGKTVVLINYSFMFSSFFLFLGAIWLSVYTFREEYMKKTFMTLYVKPLAKTTILLGKFLGVYVFTGFLFLLACGILVGNIFMITSKASAEDKVIIAREVLSGRSVLVKNTKDIEIKPQQKSEFLFDLPKNYQNTHDVFVRFRFYVADTHRVGNSIPYVSSTWSVKGTDYIIEKKFSNNDFNEIIIPAKYIKNNQIPLIYTNISTNPVVFFADNIEIMAETERFYVSLAKLIFIKMLILALFAAFGIFAASYMTFVPAVFVSISFYFIANSVSFLKVVLSKAVILDHGECAHCHVQHEGPVEPSILEDCLRVLLKGVVYIFPDIESLDKVDFLVAAKAIALGQMLNSANILLLYTAVFLSLGAILFVYRGDYVANE